MGERSRNRVGLGGALFGRSGRTNRGRIVGICHANPGTGVVNYQSLKRARREEEKMVDETVAVMRVSDGWRSKEEVEARCNRGHGREI